jgi:hypothetical protein
LKIFLLVIDLPSFLPLGSLWRGRFHKRLKQKGQRADASGLILFFSFLWFATSHVFKPIKPNSFLPCFWVAAMRLRFTTS